MSKKNNDFDFISSKFREEDVKAPENLSEENIKKLIENGDTENPKVIPFKKNRHPLRAAIAVAACFVVVFVSAVYLKDDGRIQQLIPQTESKSSEIVDAGIKTYKDYAELEEAVNKINSYYSVKKGFGLTSKSSDKSDINYGATADGELAVNENSAEVAQKGPQSKSFSTTNKQVEAVDEGDIIKTDGKNIFYIGDEYTSVVSIFSVTGGKPEPVTKIYSSFDDASFREMYVKGNKLILVGERTDYSKVDKNNDKYYDYVPGEGYTFVHTYNISDIKNPKLVGKYEQSGYYNTSRMIDSCVYVVSNYGDFYYGLKDFGDRCVPCATGADGKTVKMPIEDICGIEGGIYNRYSVIGAVDVYTKSKAKKTKAILGVNQQVYCNEKNLYITGTVYKNEGDRESGQYTKIVKLSVEKTDIKVVATGAAKGTVNDQFSLDEKDGNLRIALTDYNFKDDKDINCLYVLDKDLKIIGQTDGFAKNEHIEAVRFMGDTAYVITYEQTDPLFIMDLSNPKEPKITGEVKIDGFSSLLTPVDDNTMLGIGYSTTEEEWGIVADGLKLALFDVSDKNHPKVLDEFEIHDSGSEAQNNHKALVINQEKGYFAIPFENYDYAEYDEYVEENSEDEDFDSDSFERDYENGVLVIRIKNGKLDVDNLKTKKDENIKRCVYIGDYLYAPDANAKDIYSFIVK